MHLRQLIQPATDWLDAPTPRRVVWVALTAVAGLAVYGFTVGFWRDPLMGVCETVWRSIEQITGGFGVPALSVIVLILVIPIAQAIQKNHQTTPKP
jgi:hypothetical protein